MSLSLSPRVSMLLLVTALLSADSLGAVSSSGVPRMSGDEMWPHGAPLHDDEHDRDDSPRGLLKAGFTDSEYSSDSEDYSDSEEDFQPCRAGTGRNRPVLALPVLQPPPCFTPQPSFRTARENEYRGYLCNALLQDEARPRHELVDSILNATTAFRDPNNFDSNNIPKDRRRAEALKRLIVGVTPWLNQEIPARRFFEIGLHEEILLEAWRYCPHCLRFETDEDGEQREVRKLTGNCRHSYKHFAGTKPFTEAWKVLEEKLSANSVVHLETLTELVDGVGVVEEGGGVFREKPVASLRFVVVPRRAGGFLHKGLVQVQYVLELVLLGCGNVDGSVVAQKSADVGFGGLEGSLISRFAEDTKELGSWGP